LASNSKQNLPADIDIPILNAPPKLVQQNNKGKKAYLSSRTQKQVEEVDPWAPINPKQENKQKVSVTGGNVYNFYNYYNI